MLRLCDTPTLEPETEVKAETEIEIPNIGETPALESTAETEVTKDNSVPKDTLDGDGLKNRKLSDIFEQFVPTETISADNAVPFPVDI